MTSDAESFEAYAVLLCQSWKFFFGWMRRNVAWNFASNKEKLRYEHSCPTLVASNTYVDKLRRLSL